MSLNHSNKRNNILITLLFFSALAAFLYFHLYALNSHYKSINTDDSLLNWLGSSENDIYLLRGISSSNDGKSVSSIKDFIHSNSEVSQLVIRGSGLTSIEWEQLEQSKIDVQLLESDAVSKDPKSFEPDFVKIDFRTEAQIGEPVLINGILNLKDSDNDSLSVRVESKVSGIVAESKRIVNGRFELTWMPKDYGKQLYQLQLVEKDLVLASQPIAIIVTRSKTLNALLLQTSPSFEFNYLRKWLAQESFQVFSDIEISAKNTLKQFTQRESYYSLLNNTDGSTNEETENNATESTGVIGEEQKKSDDVKLGMNKIKESWQKSNWLDLVEINLVVIEFSRFTKLQDKEFERLEKFSNLGAHIVIVMDRNVEQELQSFSSERLKDIFKSFNVQFQLSPVSETVIPKGFSKWSGDTDNKTHQDELLQTGEINKGSLMPPLTVDGLKAFSSSGRLKELVKGDAEQGLVYRVESIEATLTVSRILDSYQWQLSGHSVAYTKLWQKIIDQPEWISYAPVVEVKSEHLPTVGYPIEVCADFFHYPEPLSIQTASNDLRTYNQQFPFTLGINANSKKQFNFRSSDLESNESDESNALRSHSRKCRYVYPETPGWYHVVRGWEPMSDDIAFGQQERLSSFYVYPRDSWNAALRYHKNKMTEQRMNQKTNDWPMNWNNVLRWLCLMLALIALSTLWFRERKEES
ncbi:MAG: hypothetical protein HWE27_01255 [Gammaproteobacteria bacterium]|nr:hypothetical protein [Gammaproteobacteria bacterium]